ncbi:hypothetical protein D3C76_917570 [compost metagenome]
MAANGAVAQIYLLAQGTYRKLGSACRKGAVVDQVAVTGQLDARGQADGVLESRIAAGVPAGIEIGKAVQRFVVVGWIAEQMGDAEIHASAPAEHFLADRTLYRIGIVLGPAFGEVDADLHRPTGVHRVEPAKQCLPQGGHADEIIENRAQLFLRAHLGQALVIGLAGGRVQLQGRIDQQVRHMQLGRSLVDFSAGDPGQPRDLRVYLEGGFLLDDGQYRTQVFIGRGNVLGGKGGIDIGGPAFTVRGFRRHQPDDFGPYLGRAGGGFFCGFRGATGQHQEGADCQSAQRGSIQLPRFRAVMPKAMPPLCLKAGTDCHGAAAM